MTYGATVLPHSRESSKDTHVIDVIRNSAQQCVCVRTHQKIQMDRS